MDLTIVSPHNRSYATKAGKCGGGAATAAERAKVTKYHNLCEENGINLMPMGFNTYGAAGEGNKMFCRQASELIADLHGTHPST